MDKRIIYANIITQVLRKASLSQPRLQDIKISSVCDPESGHFLIIATGWDKNIWMSEILFHARLVDAKVAIEDDNFEEAIADNLIAAGIAPEDIITGLSLQDRILSLQAGR